PLILGVTASAAALLAAAMLIARRRDNFLRHITALGQVPRHRMKLPHPPALALAALFSVVFSLPFLPAARMRTDHFLLELRVSCSKQTSLQVFLDDGQGFRETLTAVTAIRASTAVETYSLPIPSGTYSALRLDPPEGGTETTIHAMQVTTASGRALAKIDLTGFASVQQSSLRKLEGDRLQIVSAPGSDDPQIAAKFASPLIVRLPASEILREVAPRAAIILAGLLAVMMAVLNSSFVKSRLVAAVVWMQERPTKAIMLLAALSVAASAYPVIFSGRSFVSPNLGTNLLYDRFPTLPGYRSTAMSDPKLSDVGAVMWQHVPFSVIQQRALSQGELPLWNRYNALGVPLLGQGQSMFGDPLHFLVIAARGAAWAWDLKYLIAKWLFATGLGLAVLALVKDQGTKGRTDKGTNSLKDEARSEGSSCASLPDSPTPLLPPSVGPLVPWSLGPLIVAVAAPFIGFFLYRINHPAYFSLCYAPWPLYCLLRVANAPDRRGVTLWSAGLLLANLALMNSGTVKEAYMLLLSVNFSGLCVLLASAAGWRDKLSRLGTLAWFGLLFVLITAPVWNTFLNTLRQAYTGYNAASAYQLQPSLLLGLFDEIFHRPLLSNNQVYAPSLNFLLLGGLLLFLATLRRHFTRPAVMALAASSILPLALAFGLLSPEWIVKVPFLGNIAHLDNTFSCVLIVLWTVLAGVGFTEAIGRLGTREGRDDLIIAGLLLFGLVFAWLAFGHAAHRPIYGPIFTVNQPGRTLPVDRFILDYLVVLLAALTGLAVAVHLALRRRRLTAASGLAIAGCTILLLWRHGAHDSALGFEDFVNRPARRADFHARSEAMETARATQTTTPARGYGFHGNFFAGWTGVYGLEGVHGPDALVNPFVRELMGASGVTRMWDWRFYAEAREAENVRPFFDALNVRHYFDLASDQGLLGRALRLVRTADLDVYESPTAWPRAFFSDRVVTYATPAELAARFRASAGRPFAAIQKDDHPAQGALSAVPRAESGATVNPATGYRLSVNSTSFTVRANGPGVIAVLEAHWPGDFRATINGREADVIRVNHAFNGIVVNAAGEHRVTLRYWPRDLSRDLTLAGIGLILLAASLLLTLRRERTT
ncbi:MAG: hypothetical protein RLZZ221_1661, partial [Verrucomicrobiota bacterium]